MGLLPTALDSGYNLDEALQDLLTVTDRGRKSIHREQEKKFAKLCRAPRPACLKEYQTGWFLRPSDPRANSQRVIQSRIPWEQTASESQETQELQLGSGQRVMKRGQSNSPARSRKFGIIDFINFLNSCPS